MVQFYTLGNTDGGGTRYKLDNAVRRALALAEGQLLPVAIIRGDDKHDDPCIATIATFDGEGYADVASYATDSEKLAIKHGGILDADKVSWRSGLVEKGATHA